MYWNRMSITPKIMAHILRSSQCSLLIKGGVYSHIAHCRKESEKVQDLLANRSKTSLIEPANCRNQAYLDKYMIKTVSKCYLYIPSDNPSPQRQNTAECLMHL